MKLIRGLYVAFALVVVAASSQTHAQDRSTLGGAWAGFFSDLKKTVDSATGSATPSASEASGGGMKAGGLAEVKRLYEARFKTSITDRFEDSPFEGWYLVTGYDGNLLLKEGLTIVGYGNSWKKVSPDGSFVKMTPDEVEVVRTDLRKSIKTDWLVTTGHGSGSRAAIVVSAPNCPSCQVFEQSMKTFGNQIDAKVYALPILLGDETRGFTNAVMCSEDRDAKWDVAVRYKKYSYLYSECQRSRWVTMVLVHTFPKNSNGQVLATTPAFIRKDGTVTDGWDPNSTVAKAIEHMIRY